MSNEITDFGSVKMIELRDQSCLEWCQKYGVPDTHLMQMRNRVALSPQYDDMEVSAMLELWCDKAPFLYANLMFIAGNKNEEDNGWIVRIFPGIRKNSELYFSIYQTISSICVKTKLDFCDFDS